MAIERDLADIKAKLLELETMLRRIMDVRVAPDDEEYEFNKTEAARYCGISTPTFVRYAEEVGLPGHLHEGRHFTFFLKSELDTIIRVKRLDRKRKH